MDREKSLLVPRGAWIMLGILIIFYVLNAFDRTILSLMVVYVKRDLHVSDSQIGLLLGLAFALFYGAFGIPVGALIDRVSRRLVMFSGVVFWSLATIACAFAGSFNHLLIARMFLGIGEATFVPTAHAMMGDTFPRARLGTAMSIFYFGGVVGISVSVAAGGAAVAHFATFDWVKLGSFTSIRGWQVPFVIIGIVGVLMAALTYAFREPPRHLAHHSDLTSIWTLLDRRKAMLGAFFGSMVMYAMVLQGSIAWTPTYLSRAFGWDIKQAGYTYSLIYLFGCGAGMLLSGLVVDRLFSRGFKDAHFRVFIFGIAAALPCGIIAYTSSSPTVFVIGALGLHFFGFCWPGYASAMMQLITPPEARGRMAAIYLFIITLVGSGGGPLVIGLFTQHLFGDEKQLGSAIALLCGLVSVIAICSAWMGLRPLRRAIEEIEARRE